jgi:hypothetical protein
MKNYLTSMLKETKVERAMTKAITLRLDDERAATLELVARADNQTLTEAVRVAIDAHIAERRCDEDFKERLRRRHEQERALYERLSR